jgi:hypothetical protein
MPKGKTVIQAEKDSKRQAGELDEYLGAVGQVDEVKAAKWVKEEGKEIEKEVQQEQNTAKEVLEKSNKYTIRDYWRTLADSLTQMALREEFPWQWHVKITDKGIATFIMSPDKHLFVRAFKPCHDPKYDLNAMYKVLESAWAVINKKEEDATEQMA